MARNGDLDPARLIIPSNEAGDARQRRSFGAVQGAECRCGHDLSAHEHYRGGAECSACECAQFRRSSTHIRRWLTRLASYRREFWQRKARGRPANMQPTDDHRPGGGDQHFNS